MFKLERYLVWNKSLIKVLVVFIISIVIVIIWNDDLLVFLSIEFWWEDVFGLEIRYIIVFFLYIWVLRFRKFYKLFDYLFF